METFSALLALCAGNSPITGEFPSHKGQWRGALMFPLFCAWTNGWVDNRDVGDLGRHRAYYDVTMKKDINRNKAHLTASGVHNSWNILPTFLAETLRNGGHFVQGEWVNIGLIMAKQLYDFHIGYVCCGAREMPQVDTEHGQCYITTKYELSTAWTFFGMYCILLCITMTS